MNETPSTQNLPNIVLITCHDTVPPYIRETPSALRELAELQGAVHHMDTHVECVLDGLRLRGLTDDTLVILTTVHGVALPRASSVDSLS